MGRDGLSVVEKAGAILRRFLDERAAALTYNEVLSGTTMSRATAHRLLTDLVAEGFLTQSAHRDEYRLGPLLLSAASLAQQLTSVSERAIPRMERLRDEFGETMVLAELHGDAVVPVRRVDGLYEMRMNQEVGRAYPAYAGGTGKVLLAHLAPEALSRYLARVELMPLTPHTVTSAEALRAQLAAIRAAGIAVSRGERVPDAIAVAAPIFNGSGAVDTALTLSGLASRFDGPALITAAQAVRRAAEEISQELGFFPARGEPRAEDLLDASSRPHAILREMCADAYENVPAA